MTEHWPPPSFDWEQWKADINPLNHEGVTFPEAVTVFHDEARMSELDWNHSDDEVRFKVIGISSKLRILLVVHGEVSLSGSIKIISARKANKNERNRYING